MPGPHQIALVGFDPFEKTTFESFFRLATRREPGYAMVASQSDAALLIINGDNAAALTDALHRRTPNQRVLVVGFSQNPAAQGHAFQARPIRFMSVLVQVESLLGQVGAVAPAKAAAPMPVRAAEPRPDFAATQPFNQAELTAMSAKPPQFEKTQPFAPLQAEDSEPDNGFAATQAFAPLLTQKDVPPAIIPKPKRRDDPITEDSLAAYRRAPVPAPAPERPSPLAARSRAFEPSTAGFMGLNAEPAALDAGSTVDDVLVVDDSDVALKFMQNRLGRIGFRVTVVRTGQEALDELPKRNFRYAFVDVMMEGMDGFQTCRAIKKAPTPSGVKPVVILLSSRGGVIDKMRGSLAGADSYLTKPLNDVDLNKVLAKHEAASGASFAASRYKNSATMGATVPSSTHGSGRPNR